MSEVTFSREQTQAIEGVLDWYSAKIPQPFTIAGYAGTGKTTVLGEIVRQLKGKLILMCAPTGKAAAAMRAKVAGTGVQVGTVHSCMYYPPKETDDKELHFRKRKHIEADLVIVDESSMLNTKMLSDVMSFGVPTILVGDSFQLPPVSGDRISQLDSPDAKLTHVFRQALDNPVIRAATEVRLEGRLPVDGFNKSETGACGIFSKKDRRAYSLAEQFYKAVGNTDTTILCYTNRTRCKLNAKIRDRLGYNDILSQNEKIVVLKNDYKHTLYNGQVYTVRKVEDSGGGMLTVGLDGAESDLCVSAKLLGEERVQRVPEYIVPMHYGYALSVHKSQGSEWQHVLLFDEHPHDDEYLHWLYTGITRAKKNLLVIR